MKYIILLCILVLSINLFANPMAPSIFSEFFTGPDNSWWLELSPIGIDLGVGDSLRISNQSDFISFRIEQPLAWGQCLVIHSNQYPLQINHSGASLTASVRSTQTGGEWFEYYPDLEFTSSYPNNCIPGQSLVYTLMNNAISSELLLAAEATPSPGTHPYEVTSFGSINGFVRDQNLIPIPNARLTRPFHISEGVFTNENGSFIFPDLEGMQQTILVYVGATQYLAENINVIPTQTLTHDFRLMNFILNQDFTQDQIAPFLISANPIHAGEQIKFAMGNTVGNDFVLKIYNVKGESVSELHSAITSGEIVLKLPSDIASGIYLYKLGDGHKILKKGKFTVIE